MDTSEKFITRLPRLEENGSNYSTWKAEMETAFVSKGLSRYIEGTAKVPVDPRIPVTPLPPTSHRAADPAAAAIATATAGASTSGPSAPSTSSPVAVAATPEEVEDYLVELDEWRQKHAKVKHILYMTLPDTVKLEIADVHLASDLWTLVTKRYEEQGPLAHIDLLTQMMELRALDDEDGRIALAAMKKLKSQYVAAGGNLPNNIYIGLIVAAMPRI